MESEEHKVKRPLDLLGHIEKIVSLSGEKGVGKKFAVEAKAHIRFVMNKLELKPHEAVLFSHLLTRFDEGFVSISTLTESMKISKIKLLRYMDVLESLERKKLVNRRVVDTQFLIGTRKDEYEIGSYKVPLEVVNAVRKGEKVTFPVYRNLPVDQFFMVLHSTIKQLGTKLGFKPLLGEIDTLFQDNSHLPFPGKIKGYPLEDCNFVLLAYFCSNLAVNGDDEIPLSEIEELFDLMEDSFFIIQHEFQCFRRGSSELFTQGLIENTGDNSFMERDRFALTEKAKKELLGEIDLKNTWIIQKHDQIPVDKIAPKELFYGGQEASQIKRIKEILDPLQFSAIRKRLTEKGMRTGFACLFSGPPGTGKTETVYQLARETGRNIMMVDISKTKSMWFGQSEKIIKDAFDRYRFVVETAIKCGEPEPLMFFNEADGVIGKRRDLGSDNTAQTENSIQNIILQEMENLTGILIATTNFIQNLDKAFERRFIFKVEFVKPTLTARVSIWNTMLPGLPLEKIQELASRFDLTGGQIENIARKYEVEQIITGKEASLELLITFCNEEKMGKKESRIGFGV